MQYPGSTKRSYPLTAAAETGSGYTVLQTRFIIIIIMTYFMLMFHFQN